MICPVGVPATANVSRSGKRSLIVLNKTDLYTEADQETILARLRERVRGFRQQI